MLAQCFVQLTELLPWTMQLRVYTHGVHFNGKVSLSFSASIDFFSISTLHGSHFAWFLFILLRTRFDSIDWFLIDCYCCPHTNVFTINRTHVFVLHCRSIYGTTCLYVCVYVMWIANTKTIWKHTHKKKNNMDVAKRRITKDCTYHTMSWISANNSISMCLLLC